MSLHKVPITTQYTCQVCVDFDIILALQMMPHLNAKFNGLKILKDFKDNHCIRLARSNPYKLTNDYHTNLHYKLSMKNTHAVQ